jgi:hypothetical protein
MFESPMPLSPSHGKDSARFKALAWIPSDRQQLYRGMRSHSAGRYRGTCQIQRSPFHEIRQRTALDPAVFRRVSLARPTYKWANLLFRDQSA